MDFLEYDDKKMRYVNCDLGRWSRPVIQYDKNFNEIRRFSSISSAARAFNIDESNIRKACKGTVKVSHGFRWRYVSDINELACKGELPCKDELPCKPVYVKIESLSHVLDKQFKESEQKLSPVMCTLNPDTSSKKRLVIDEQYAAKNLDLMINNDIVQEDIRKLLSFKKRKL